jgi:hypothetical protein
MYWNLDLASDGACSLTLTLLAMVSALDEAVGNVTDLLEARGLLDDTLIVFLSDVSLNRIYTFIRDPRTQGQHFFVHIHAAPRTRVHTRAHIVVIMP